MIIAWRVRTIVEYSWNWVPYYPERLWVSVDDWPMRTKFLERLTITLELGLFMILPILSIFCQIINVVAEDCKRFMAFESWGFSLFS